jgi:hypothetical protein
MKHKVNLFLVGAAKCGTTSLYKMLGHHSQIFVGEKKEPHFFAADCFMPSKRYAKRLCLTSQSYDANYESAQNEKYYLDASVYYLYFDEVAQRIFDYNPEAKIIIITRDPVSRFYSHYKMLRKEGVTHLSLSEFIQHPIDNNGLNVLRMGEYQTGIERYKTLFGSQCLHLKFEELHNPKELMVKLSNFLNIEIETLTMEHENKSGLPKSRFLAYLHMNFPLTLWLKAIMPKGKLRSMLGETILKTFYEDKPMSVEDRLSLKSYYDTHP